MSARNALPADPAANAASNPRRIDVHHHMLPPDYASLTRDRILEITSGDTTVLKWTPEVTLEQMEQFGVASSILSLPVPGAWHGGKENSRKLARISNEYGARLSKDYPGRFGTFAALPLPDVDGSLAEVEYAFDALGADGAYLQTSYDDKWPGDPAFAPCIRRVESPQGHRFRPSDRTLLLRKSDPWNSVQRDRVCVRHDARDHQFSGERHVCPLPRHSIYLLPFRRDHACAGCAHQRLFPGAQRPRLARPERRLL